MVDQAQRGFVQERYRASTHQSDYLRTVKFEKFSQYTTTAPPCLGSGSLYCFNRSRRRNGKYSGSHDRCAISDLEEKVREQLSEFDIEYSDRKDSPIVTFNAVSSSRRVITVLAVSSSQSGLDEEGLYHTKQ